MKIPSRSSEVDAMTGCDRVALEAHPAVILLSVLPQTSVAINCKCWYQWSSRGPWTWGIGSHAAFVSKNTLKRETLHLSHEYQFSTALPANVKGTVFLRGWTISNIDYFN